MKKIKYYYRCIKWLWENRKWENTRQKWKAMDKQVKGEQRMTHDEIVERLNQKKKAMKWNYEDISERSGYSIGAVARLFQGENVRMQTFEDICEAMGIEVNIL